MERNYKNRTKRVETQYLKYNKSKEAKIIKILQKLWIKACFCVAGDFQKRYNKPKWIV